eukprot:11099942-Alexandrium_andersonii.AAC.1
MTTHGHALALRATLRGGPSEPSRGRAPTSAIRRATSAFAQQTRGSAKRHPKLPRQSTLAHGAAVSYTHLRAHETSAHL